LAPALEDVSVEELAEMLATLDQLSDEMEPFNGDAKETEDLARFLYGLNHESAALPGPAAGAALFDNHCAACHAVEEMAEIASGWEREEFFDTLDSLDDLSDEMVPFAGTPEEKEVLTGYIYDRAEAN
jgi:hypothetical protein